MNREPVRYTVRFPDLRAHYIQVEAAFAVPGRVELFLPVWTPGSYLIREYSRHIEALTARDEWGRDLRAVKTRKNRWRIDVRAARRIVVSYRVYCREMSVRSNYVDPNFALLNGAATFITIAGALDCPHEVRLELPSAWAMSISGLEEVAPNHYAATDYDELIDSPVYAGNPAVHRFDIGGIPHLLVNEGEAGLWDGPRSAADTEKIVRTAISLWSGSMSPGAIPYRRYVFLNLLTETGGGLEHRNSCCIMASRWATRTRAPYLGWLNLVSHEYFHTWNVKRLRPAELGPFDYETENTTRALWVAEGITEYYGSLIVRRAGLAGDAEYLGAEKEPARDSLSGLIHALQTTPGRLAHSVAEASFDAWIRLYRPDENSKNTSISYYVKGAVIAWLLDARIRRSTAGRKSLDDAMRAAFDRYAGARGFGEGEFERIAGEVAEADLTDFFRHAVDSTAELDYSEALDWFGLRFKEPGAERKAWLGIETRSESGRLLVARAIRGGPAETSGLSAEDELIALDDFRVRAEKFDKQMEAWRAGDRLSILAARRGRMERFEIELAEQPPRWRLEIRHDATEEQKARFSAWLSGVRT